MTAINVDEQFIGAGSFYLDDEFVGVTREANVFRVVQEMAAPALNGVRGPLASTDYITSTMAEMEVTLVELSAGRLPVYIPGAAVTAQNADGVLAGGGGLDTTLASPASAGATTLFLTSVTGAAVGDVIQVGPPGSTREFRTLTRVGTAGASDTGTGVDVNVPLTSAHAAAEVAQELASTTLAADAPANSTTLKLASVAGLAVGDFIQFGYPTDFERRKLTRVGTGGAGGNGVDVDVPTTRPHRSGDAAFEVTSEGGTLIEAAATRRIQTADYHKWELRVPGVGGREIRFGIRQGINTANAEFSAEDSENPLGPRLTIQSRIDPANIEASPWYIQRV